MRKRMQVTPRQFQASERRSSSTRNDVGSRDIHHAFPSNQEPASSDVHEKPLHRWSERVRLEYSLNA